MPSRFIPIPDQFFDTEFLEKPVKFLHVFMFRLHAWVYIPVQCDVHARMTKNFTKCFYVKAYFNASGCEGMTQCMKFRVLDSAFLQNCFEAVFHRSRFDEVVFMAA